MKKTLLVSAALLLGLASAQAQIANGKVKIGLMSDLSGPYESDTGNGSVLAAQMAIDEFGGKVNGVPIELLPGDHQNKPDVGVTLANKWFDVDKVDAVFDLVNSAVAFAVLDIAKQKNKAVLLVGAGSADFTGKACAPDNLAHWAYDTYMMSNATGGMVNTLGKKWFMITADYVYGKTLAASVKSAVEANGGQIVGETLHPLGTTDYSSYILQAQASGADVLVMNNGGDDSMNSLKAAAEFGLMKKMKVVPGGIDNPRTLKALTLEVGQGVTMTTAWWSGISDKAKAFAEKFTERSPRKAPPAMMQAGNYSAVRSYLKGVEAANSTDPKKVFAKMREMKIDDAFTPNGTLRPDGRMVHDAYIVQIKSPAESKSEWDLLKPITVLQGDKLFRPLSAGACPALAAK